MTLFSSKACLAKGIGEEGKTEEGWGERKSDAWYKNPSLFCGC